MALFATKLAQKAETEFTAYSGKKETQSPLKERIGTYWDYLGRPELDGGDADVPWSAAFISYMVNIAGAAAQFPYSAQHSVYFYRTINDKLIKKTTPFWGYKPGDVTVEPGDILGMNRESASKIDYAWAAHHPDYPSHADIVIDVQGAAIHTIGGNVGNRVGQKIFEWHGGKLRNQHAHTQEAFVVIRSSLP
ncbi:DUF2272 domain-containing protein [Hansschlegelia sp. KR7-227]|jgi:hypothetical protein|uniref:DUF2272 domain-containing protein n=1 Tax=Hansschlegelia sp. KR7-227 TaxID=3400914 RepID=UPI003C10E223